MVPNRAALGMVVEPLLDAPECRSRYPHLPGGSGGGLINHKGPLSNTECQRPMPDVASTPCLRPNLEVTKEVKQQQQDEAEVAVLQPEAREGPVSPRALTVFHAAVVLYYLAVDYEMFTCSVKLKKTGHPVTKMFLGGVTQFFTDWNQVIHQAYFLASLVDDLLGQLAPQTHAHTRLALARFRRDIYGPVLLPATCLTVVNFWGFYVVAPHLMLDDLIVFYPSIMNHAMHTIIAVLVYSELLIVRQHVLPRSTGIKHATALMASYSGWLYLIGTITQKWPYRFLEVMNLRQHILFVPCMFLHGYFWFFVNEAIIKFVWGNYNRRKKDTQE